MRLSLAAYGMKRLSLKTALDKHQHCPWQTPSPKTEACSLFARGVPNQYGKESWVYWHDSDPTAMAFGKMHPPLSNAVQQQLLWETGCQQDCITANTPMKICLYSCAVIQQHWVWQNVSPSVHGCCDTILLATCFAQQH